MEKDNTKAGLSKIFRALGKSLEFKNDIKWPSFIAITLYHIVGIYWCSYFTLPVKWQTVIFGELEIFIYLDHTL